MLYLHLPEAYDLIMMCSESVPEGDADTRIKASARREHRRWLLSG